MNIGVNLKLSALDKTDCQTVRRWRNDYRVWKWCRQHDLISDVEQEAWYERQAKDPTIRMYRIDLELNQTVEAIGVCGFTSLDFVNRRAEFSLYVAPEKQRRGYGKQALKVLLAHGFQNLGLNVIWGETFDGNPAAKVFESLGFVHEGTRRQFYWRDGRFIDAHLYAITRDEWISTLQRSQRPSSASSSSGPSSSEEPSSFSTGPSVVLPIRSPREVTGDEDLPPAG